MQAKSFFTATLMLLATQTSISLADEYMYKWKNAEGVTQYTKRPPVGDIEYLRIRVQSNEKSDEIPLSDNTPPAKTEMKKDSSYSGWRQDNCRIALENLDILETAEKIRVGDGEGRLLTEEERKEKIAKMQAQKSKYCSEEPETKK